MTANLPGDCFVVALALFESPATPAIPARRRLVHGLPVGNGDLNRGLRYWHAWLEVDRPDEGWCVYDWSNGKTLSMLREVYYQAGQLTELTVHRYTERMVTSMRYRHGTCGPWVPGWQKMEELPEHLSTAMRP